MGRVDDKYLELLRKRYRGASSLSERDSCSAGQIDGKLPLLESLKRADSRERRRWLASSEWLTTKKRSIKR
jgi:hypothetical protein